MKNAPNIVFLVNDHQAYYRHGWDGGPQIQRPNFDRLAAGGVAFARSYTACPLCGPARRTLLTGLFPHNHGELKNDYNHPFDKPTYTEILAANGYRNCYYGKWHAGPGTALDHACEGFCYPTYNNPYTKPEYKAYLERTGLPEPEILVERVFRGERPQSGKGLAEGARYRQQGRWCEEQATGIMLTPKETHEAFFLASLACDKLRELAGKQRPFSLRVDFWGPHPPYFPTQEFADLYDPATIPEYGNFADNLATKPEIYRIDAALKISENRRLITPNPLPWTEWQHVLARCYAHVSMVDAAGGLILDALDELGLSENTLVVWTSDHGDAVGSHGGHFDKDCYMPEEVLRVPLALRWPRRLPAGCQMAALVSNVDLAPTLLDAAGIGFPDSVDGRSLLSLCAGEGRDWRDDLLCEIHGHIYGDHIGRLVVTDRYKYIVNQGDMDELYDLHGDPYEMVNLIDDAAHASILADMRRRLAAWQRKTGDPAQQGT
jgi:arylsulfatase A-like enzyme